MFWTEIHLQFDQHVFNGYNTRKSAMILYNFGSGYFFFPITAPLSCPKCKVIQQIKKCGQIILRTLS